MLVKYYREAYTLRRKERNYELWLQGLYIYHALCDVSPLFRFSTHPQKAIPYPEEPFPISKADAEEQEKAKEKQKFEQMKAKMEAMVRRTRKKEVEKNG